MAKPLSPFLTRPLPGRGPAWRGHFASLKVAVPSKPFCLARRRAGKDLLGTTGLQPFSSTDCCSPKGSHIVLTSDKDAFCPLSGYGSQIRSTYRGCQVSPNNRRIEHRTQVWERTAKHLIHPLQEDFKIPWKPREDHRRKINLTFLQTINLYISKYNPQNSQQTKVINYLTCHLHKILSST